jgi:hypothetical protein
MTLALLSMPAPSRKLAMRVISANKAITKATNKRRFSSSETLEQDGRQGAETRPRGGRAIRPRLIRTSWASAWRLSPLFAPPVPSRSTGSSPPGKAPYLCASVARLTNLPVCSSVGWWLGLRRADTFHLRVNWIHEQLRRFLNRQWCLSSLERRIFLPVSSPGVRCLLLAPTVTVYFGCGQHFLNFV